MRSIIYSLALIAVVACAGAAQNTTTTTAAGMTIRAATNTVAPFEHYRTFSFGPTEAAPMGYHESARAPDLHRRMRPLVAAALARRGYTEVPSKGDIVIMLGVGRREVTVHEESFVNSEWSAADESADYVEGELVIDATDGSAGMNVWHGASEAKLDPDQEDNAALKSTVDALIAKFPAAKPELAPAWPERADRERSAPTVQPRP